MELLDNLALGFSTALLVQNVLYCFVGVLLGTAVGVLPGIGPTATVAMLLPITFNFEPVTALIMLAGIYYGAQYGGSTTAILINLPGESSAAVTALDGHEMARQGRAGPALAAAAIGSFIAGTVATVVLAVAAPPLASVALKFGPAEYFSLVLFGLIVSIALARGSTLKALAMIALGVLFGTVGQDIYTGTPRFVFDQRELYGGIDFVSVAVGMFGVAEILRNLENEQTRTAIVSKVKNLWPTARGPAPDRRPDPARHRSRRRARRTARRWPRAGVVHLVRRREADLEAAAGVRARRDRGRRRPRVGEQRRRADVVHPAAHPGPARPPGDGADGRRVHRPRHHPGPERHQRRTGAVLGPDRVDVDRQRAAPAAEPAADRHLGAHAAHPVRGAVPDDHPVRRDRHVLAGRSTRTTSTRSRSSGSWATS